MNEIVEFIAKHKVVAIRHGLYDNGLIKTIRALYGGDMRVVKVTSDRVDPDAVKRTCGAIRTTKEHFPQVKAGSGTVTCIKYMLATEKAGGELCLSPDVNTEMTHAAKEVDLISIPEAVTSTEILQAHNTGANIVEIFLAGWLRSSYPKDIKRSINHVKFLAVAGANEESFKGYLNAGYCAAGTSDRFIGRKVIARENFEELTRRARIFTDIVNTC